jgi:hypothetical protein
LDPYDAAKIECALLQAPKYQIRQAGFHYEWESDFGGRDRQPDPGMAARRVLAAEKDRVCFYVELHGEQSSYDLRDFKFIMDPDGGPSVQMKGAPLEMTFEEFGDHYVWIARYSPQFPLRDPAGQPYLTDTSEWLRLRIIRPSGKEVRVVWTLHDPPVIAVEMGKPTPPTIWDRPGT